MTKTHPLAFTRDGRHLVVADHDTVTIIEVRGEARRTFAADVGAVAAMTDEVWIVSRDGLLRRHGLDGRSIGSPLSLPIDSEAALVAAPFGPAAAIWTSAPPVAVLDDLGALVLAHPGDDVLIPVAMRRWVRCSGSRVTMPSGAICALGNAARAVGGSGVLDGNALALIIEHPRGRDAILAALATGRLMHAISLPPGLVRIGARRAIAAILVEPRRIELVDLRFGRRLGTATLDQPASDFALDPDGALFALRMESGAVELARVADRIAATAHEARRERAEASDDEPASQVAEVVDEPAAAEVVLPTSVVSVPPVRIPDKRASVSRPLALGALVPRRDRPVVARADALAHLDREMRTVALRTLRAIAHAWDTRRLGYGNEGKHPYELEVAALVGMNAGFAADYVAAARDHLAEHEALLAADPTHRAEATPLATLADELGLSAVAVEVLLAIAAPSLWGEAARLYGILGNDPGRALVDEMLVTQILEGHVDRHDIAAALDSRAPLVRYGIVEVAGTRPFAALTIEPVVLARLRGELPALGPAVTVRDVDRTLEDLELASGVLDHAIASLTTTPTEPARIAVSGRPGSGRRTLLAALAREANRALAVIDATELPRHADAFVIALRTSLRRAQLAGFVPAVWGLEDVVFDDRRAGDVATAVLRAHPGPLAVVTPLGASPPLPANHIPIELPVLGETERLAVWERALAARGLWMRDAPGIAARYRIGPGVIARALASGGLTSDAPCDDQVIAFIRKSRDARLGEHARRVERLASWTDLVLPPDVLDSLRELVGRVRHRRTVFEDWGVGRMLTTSRGITALFQGQPGTGKTLVAGVIARELGLELYQVDLSKVMSKWLGETERNLATIFDAAEDGQVILLFDEADSLFAKRTEVRSSNDRYANLEVNYLLQRLDAFEGIAILTTNSGGSIDNAFKRRMSFRLSFPFPDEETRAQLWRVHIPPEVPRAGELVFEQLARKYQLSGGYIRNACVRAAFLAAQEASMLDQRHLERAVALEFAELGKLSTSGAID